jgi:hypothetical protein
VELKLLLKEFFIGRSHLGARKRQETAGETKEGHMVGPTFSFEHRLLTFFL